MNGMRLIATVVLLVLTLPPGEVLRVSAQQPAAGAPAPPSAAAPQVPPNGQAPTIRGGIDVVRVDVFATDSKGNPITDLKQSDFEIIEDGQPQTIVQMLNNVLLFGMTPQRAVEATRFRAYQNGRVSIEPGAADSALTALRARGHTINVRPPGAEFGGAQMILIHPVSKAKITGADARREAYAVAW